MRSGRLAAWLGLAGVLLGMQVEAQGLTPGKPGPFVIDVRGVTSGIPASPGLYPDLGDQYVVPARGFGFDVGAHVYLFSLGPARLGIGANYIEVRGTATDADATLQTIAPQLSFNFGTSDGWSYLSVGAGTARVKAIESASSSAINAGGGARWFMNRHLAVGFDVRFHKIAADGDTMGQSTQVSASIGFSLK
jgi:Outer membrane protein beta-barrel domain